MDIVSKSSVMMEDIMNNLKRFGAIALVVLLVGLYIATLVLAFIDNPVAHDMFKACIVMTIGVPVIIYAYTLIYKYLKNRNQ